jgi:hypothetical protein
LPALFIASKYARNTSERKQLFVALVVVMATIAGFLFGTFFQKKRLTALQEFHKKM